MSLHFMKLEIPPAAHINGTLTVPGDKSISHRAAIFGALNALEPGEVMHFVNDHDPLPLLAQIEQHFGPRVSIGYVTREAGNIVIDFSVNVVD